MGLYYRNSSGEDLCVSGNAGTSGDGGFSEVIANNKSLLSSLSKKIKIMAGDGISIDGDPSGNIVTITNSKTIDVATGTSNGLMSSTDKTKLDDFEGAISDSYIEALFATQEGSQITTRADVEAISTSYITNQFK